MNFENYEDMDIEEIRGSKKKSDMKILNQKRLNKYDMDDLFLEE